MYEKKIEVTGNEAIGIKIGVLIVLPVFAVLCMLLLPFIFAGIIVLLPFCRVYRTDIGKYTISFRK